VRSKRASEKKTGLLADLHEDVVGDEVVAHHDIEGAKEDLVAGHVADTLLDARAERLAEDGDVGEAVRSEHLEHALEKIPPVPEPPNRTAAVEPVGTGFELLVAPAEADVVETRHPRGEEETEVRAVDLLRRDDVLHAQDLRPLVEADDLGVLAKGGHGGARGGEGRP
jgi:hypothetical protein